ncbi:MAG: mannose-1-phosphate guanylyltransferase, partial [Myroides sp.]
MNKNYYAVIMAGGVGSRFWPVSTPEFPKQFHDMLGTGETLVQKTFTRLSQLIPKENILILTNDKYSDILKEQLPMITNEQIVLEPDMRNTAPCILYASMKIKKQNPDAVMIVAPSDHWIEDEVQFVSNLQRAFDSCESDNVLMTLGIIPTFPNTGYGYIEYNKLDSRQIKKVVQFREKPDYQTAKTFIQRRNFLWNSGIFVWNVRSILEAFEKFQPEMYQLFQAGYSTFNTSEEKQFITENYSKAENISIDYAVMEKADNVFILPATFDWNDLGTWGSLYDKLPKDECD